MSYRFARNVDYEKVGKINLIVRIEMKLIDRLFSRTKRHSRKRSKKWKH